MYCVFTLQVLHNRPKKKVGRLPGPYLQTRWKREVPEELWYKRKMLEGQVRLQGGPQQPKVAKLLQGGLRQEGHMPGGHLCLCEQQGGNLARVPPP